MQNPRYTETKGATGPVNKFLALCLALTASSVLATAQTAGTYQITNIISDGSVPALVTDPHFINPRGISIGSDFWINTQATGLDYVALTSGTIPFTVTIPAETGGTTATGTPTGTVFYSGSGFVLPNGSPAIFLFSSLDGIITGWNVGLGTTSAAVAQVAIDNSAAGAVYTDMALLTNANGTYILASNFGASASIDVFDSSFKPAKLTGAFVDPSLPAGYAPYAVHTIGSQVYVTYAMRTVTAATPTPAPAPTPTPTPTPTPPPPSPIAPVGYAITTHGRSVQQVTGPGNGIVSVFDTNGNFVARAITGGNLNAPWGVAIAPTAFGIYGGDLLVGNFGDGLINVYDPKTFAYLGQITDTNGKSVVYPSLWEITFGTATYGDPNTLYFTAGLSGESHGLFGAISNNPTPTGTPTFGLSASSPAATVTAGSSAQTIISVAPTNNFTGAVSLACTGLPAGATCSFSPSQLSVSPASSATSMVTIQTAAAGAALTPPPGISASHAAAISFAMLLPFGSLMLFTNRRRSGKQRQLFLLSLSAFALLSAGVIAGCSGTAAPAMQAAAPTSPTPAPAPANPGTPTGQSQVTITATAGAVTQSTVVSLTVQ
jgi:hypothetical protein